MKRFWVFGGDHYYPRGGMLDLIATFDYEYVARDFCRAVHVDHDSYGARYTGVLEWAEVYDSKENKKKHRKLDSRTGKITWSDWQDVHAKLPDSSIWVARD